ncbi:hypothetical protein NLJ89_g4147 [Agrocybe chaxingu]|uniref:Ketoreductase (KR) domain-containing protein n=1 Tax=Agrocybe chaxingu TaxID=84603 RepID=A0A9W8MXX8_9AGAR|nr:hypothetical protein NLJ89_g4147 [Agrocybe chaxingu]
MVLGILQAVVSNYFPTQYALHIAGGIVVALFIRAFSQGRRTNRERDLHARTILVTGGFTPLGITLLQSLAQRGTHIIALSPDPIDSANVTTLISLLRTTTSNEQIFAEHCDLTSPSSIRSFCTKFLTGKEQRLDAILFAHEYKHIGSPNIFSTSSVKIDQKIRDSGSLATFLISTLLLPALLVAPVERDIRIINVVNPFYAAAAGIPFSPSFSYELSSPAPSSLFLREGHRSLRTVVFARHLQRVLDALPTATQVPRTEEGTSAVPVVNSKVQKSNITTASVSPGISRVDTISPLLNADWTSSFGYSYLGMILYLIFQPLLRLFTKSPTAAMQTILHALFLPTPFKVLAEASSVTAEKKDTKSQGPIEASHLEMPEEVLRPGSLYADCAVVKVKVKIFDELREEEHSRQDSKTHSRKAKGRPSLKEEVLEIGDDGEYGGELGGRLVWEACERALKIWEKENPGPPPEEKAEPQSNPQATKPLESVKDSEDQESVY